MFYKGFHLKNVILAKAGSSSLLIKFKITNSYISLGNDYELNYK